MDTTFKRRFQRHVRTITAQILVVLTTVILARIPADAAVHFQRLKSFGNANALGQNPNGGMILASDGRLYGTTRRGGLHDAGTIFRINQDCTGYAILHEFGAGTSDGHTPQGGLVEGTNGMLFGTTLAGGLFSTGTVFRISLNGSGFTLLHSFTNGNGTDGRAPMSKVIVASDKLLYGTTTYGGSNSLGTVFSIAQNGTSYSIIHHCSTLDVFPDSGLIEGADGVLYYTSNQGGTNQGTVCGSLLRLNKDGGGFNILHSFCNTQQDGQNPNAPPLFSTDGHLYGFTFYGGACTNCSVGQGGTLYRINTDGTGYTILFTFQPGTGLNPTALREASGGTFYGTLAFAGSLGGSGLLFHVGQDGSNYTVVHHFTLPEGSWPLSLVPTTANRFAGTTMLGGSNNIGAIFAVNADGNSLVSQTIPATTNVLGSGLTPFAGVIQGSDGALYGVTQYGSSNRLGSVFKISLNGSSYTELHTFGSVTNDGAYPTGTLLQGSDGFLYGTTSGGSNKLSTVFKLNPDGTGFLVLHTFVTNGIDGHNPQAGLIEGADGRLYGVTVSGGTSNVGTVFGIDKSGGNYAILHPFGTNNLIDGRNPYAALVQGADGALYGTTSFGGENGSGSVFKVNRDGTGYSVLYHIAGCYACSGLPVAQLMQASDGALYGTLSGGLGGYGAIFTLNTNGGGYTNLFDFYYAGTAQHPNGGLVEGLDGALYGTAKTTSGNGPGAIFKINKDGSAFTNLWTLRNDHFDGSGPCSTLLRASNGALYSTAPNGGDLGYGTLFQLWPPATPDLSVAPFGGASLLVVTGATGCSYQVLRSSNLFDWLVFTNFTMPAASFYSISDPTPGTSALYRAAWVP